MPRKDLFLHTVRELLNGGTADELSERLAACVAAASETGKTASLTFKLIVKPRGRTGQYELRDEITDKVPELDRGITLMFGTPEGNLQRRDPNQKEFAFPDDKEQDPGLAPGAITDYKRTV